MARFNYKAVSAAGDVIEGMIDGEDKAAAIEQLRRLGHVPIRATEVGAGASSRHSGSGVLKGQQVEQVEQVLKALKVILVLKEPKVLKELRALKELKAQVEGAVVQTIASKKTLKFLEMGMV